MTTTTEPRGPVVAPAGLDVEAAYTALAARDRRFDGRLWFGVTSTGIYCRPVCPAQTPKQANVRFFASPAAAVSSGFRACRRCRPDSAPGSRHWDHRGDLAARALRLIAQGAVDDGGVAGLAASLHVSERHLHRTPRRRGRRRSAAPRREPAGPDGPVADRADRAAAHRRRVRGRLLEHPAVQRRDAPGVRPGPVAAASLPGGVPRRGGPGPGASPAAATALRRGRRGRLPLGAGGRRRRGARPDCGGLDPPTHRPAARASGGGRRRGLRRPRGAAQRRRPA